MDREILVTVGGVSKKFCRDLKKSLWYGLKAIGRELLATNGSDPSLRPGEFWALKDISFELRRGECLGLIGSNGAGKTTLLRLLNGLIKPDTGRILMRGRVNALIALGAGFNPILTGRENIYINAAVLGLSKKAVDKIIDEVVEFAELEDFIDTPVQNYSSGMVIRLGFAIATALEPDVLLLDEVLAVGDVGFRSKCYHRVGELLRRAAVIYVAHDMNQIGRICDQVMVLSKGLCVFQGEPAVGIKAYLRRNADSNTNLVGGCKIWEPGLYIHCIRVDPPQIRTGDRAVVIVEYSATRIQRIGCLRCNFVNEMRLLVADYDSEARSHRYELHKGRHLLRIPLGQLPLTSGHYRLNLAAFDESRKVSLFHAYDQPTLKVNGSMITTSIIEMGDEE